MKEKLDKIKYYVKNELSQAGGHGWDHVFRVSILCEIIGKNEHANMEILLPAAFLHDIARHLEEERGIPHEEEGAKVAEIFLRSIDYKEEYIPEIINAIRTHRFMSKEIPKTLEAKILSDADKLDAMGAIGIVRVFMMVGERKGGLKDAIDHFNTKLLKLKSLMYTNTASKICEKRHNYMKKFLETLSNEAKGYI